MFGVVMAHGDEIGNIYCWVKSQTHRLKRASDDGRIVLVSIVGAHLLSWSTSDHDHDIRALLMIHSKYAA